MDFLVEFEVQVPAGTLTPKSETARRPSRRPQPSWRIRGISSGCGDGPESARGQRPLACTAPRVRLISTLCRLAARRLAACHGDAARIPSE
jgi:hypothetical protein